MSEARPRIRSVPRDTGAFQQVVSDDVLGAIIADAVPGAVATDVVELGVGTVNTVYRIDFANGDPLVLKVAPSRDAFGEEDDGGLRAEVTVGPYLDPLGDRVPRLVASDFAHRLLDRDWVMQTLLPGAPAVDVLPHIDERQQRQYFADLGRVARLVHDVEGERFGPVLAARYERWSDAVIDRFRALIAGYDREGLDAGPLRRIMGSAEHDRDLFDTVSPRLVHGDLWALNVLLDDVDGQLRISGVLDWDTAAWADPLSDWPIHQLNVVNPPAAAAFWDTYGPLPTDADTRQRLRYYEARHRAGARLDIRRRRLDETQIPSRFWDVSELDF